MFQEILKDYAKKDSEMPQGFLKKYFFFNIFILIWKYKY